MKKALFIFTLLINCAAGFVKSQNLVLNGGFETPAECPLTSRFDFYSKGPCKDWTCPPNGTPDYYSFTCAYRGSTTTTNNSSPQEGNAFSALYTYGKFGNQYNREYVEGTLSQTLIKGHTYYVKFYVKPMLSDRFAISAAVENIGVFFSNTIITTTGEDLVLHVTPQITNKNNPLNDTTGWTEVSGCFTASGNEKYLLIGNFETDEKSIITKIKTSSANNVGWGYLLLDNVSVEDISHGPLLAEESISKCAGDSALLEADLGKFNHLLWSTGDTNATIYLQIPGTYYVTASYQNNCQISDSIVVLNKNCNTCHFWLPDAFTPDENTRNEVFKLSSDCQVKKVHLQIFNRWGEKVLDATSLQPAWDGTFLNEPASQGFYIYKCEIIYEFNGQNQREIRNGTVTLLR